MMLIIKKIYCECLISYLFIGTLETPLLYVYTTKTPIYIRYELKKNSADPNPQELRLDIYLIITNAATECAKENTNKR